MKNKILIIVPLPVDKYEGAMNRVGSAIEMYYRHGYEVYILNIFSIHHILKIMKYKKTLNEKAHWLFMPSFSLMKNIILQRITFFVDQIWIYVLTRIISFKFIQFDMHYGGKVCRYRRKNSFLIMNYRGDSVDEFMFNNPLEKVNGWRIKSIKKDIAASIREADLLLTVSENLRKMAELYSNIPIKNYFIMPCCADINRFHIEKEILDIKSKAFEDKIVIGYCGGMAKWQNVDIVLDIVLALRKRNPKIYFLLLTSDSVGAVQDKLSMLGQENYERHSLTREEIPYYLSRMDASFLIRDNRPLNIVASPTKISESLAAGVPIIATQYAGDINEVVENGKNGLILSRVDCSSQDIDNILSYLQNVKSERDYYRNLCRRSVSDRTWNQYSEKYIDYIESKIS